MSTTSVNMGLTKWPELTDGFSHLELADNFEKLDVHDHSTGKGKTIPYGGLDALSVGDVQLRSDSVTASKILDSAVTTSKILDLNVTTGKLADLAVTTGKIAASAVSEAKLASPMAGVYRAVHQNSAVFAAGATVNTYGFAGPGTFIATATNTTVALSTIRIVSTDFAVTGLSTKLRVWGIIMTAVAPTSTFTLGLHPVTATTGTTGNIQYTIGAAVTGSTVAQIAPSANTITQLAGSDFAIPADGTYVLGCVTSVATTATNSVTAISTRLQMRHV